MELNELQVIWKQQDQKLSENIRLNRKILKKLLLAKPEKRLRWIKIEAGLRIIVPILLVIPFYKFFHYRETVDYYIGIILGVLLFILANVIRIKLFVLANKIDLTYPITAIKKEINNYEKYRLKIIRQGVLSLPFAFISILLIAPVSLMSQGTIIPLMLIILIWVGAYFNKTKYSYPEQLRKLNQEIGEIEELEKEKN